MFICLFYSLKGLALQSVPFLYGPPASLYLTIHSVRPAAWGAPLGGARRLPKSLCRAGAKNEKNVGRPRAAAVAAGGISYFYLLGTKFPDFRAKQIGLIVSPIQTPLFTIGESHITIYILCILKLVFIFAA